MNVEDRDMVNSPAHYCGNTSLECIECMELILGTDAVVDFCLCNAIKYMWRYKNKNGDEDLDKAGWYLKWVEDRIFGGFKMNLEKTTPFYRIKSLYKLLKAR